MEVQRLKSEEPEISEWKVYYHERFESMQKREKKKDSWNYFLECSGKPKLTS